MTGEISVIELTKLITYNPDTGLLVWLPRVPAMFKNESSTHCTRWNKRWSGYAALNCLNQNGGRQGLIFARNYLAHRVCWALYYAHWPTGVIDHENGDPSDNRLLNLRDVTSLENAQNMKRQIRNTSGVTGVCFNKHAKKWSSEILSNGVRTHLGYFDTFEGAVVARKQAERENNFHDNHGEQR